jgi:Nif-specific regulatory protein
VRASSAASSRAASRSSCRASAASWRSCTAYEKDLIQDALKTTRGNVATAARLLDTAERIISYKVRRCAIDARRFRS